MNSEIEVISKYTQHPLPHFEKKTMLLAFN